MCMCVYLCVGINVSISVHRGQKKALDSLELDLQTVMTSPYMDAVNQCQP